MASGEREITAVREATGISTEMERKPSVGVALVIVGIDPSRNGENITAPTMWTIVEKKSNPVTEKVAGQISFPGETSKVGEGLNENILGAVTEEFSRDSNRLNNLWYINGRSHIEGEVLINGRPADLVVLAYTGSLEDHNIPFATNEVTPNRWTTLEELLRQHPDRIRKFTRETVAAEQKHGLIGQVIDAFIHAPLNRIPLSAFMPMNFSSMEEFYLARKEKRDIDFSSVPIKS